MNHDSSSPSTTIEQNNLKDTVTNKVAVLYNFFALVGAITLEHEKMQEYIKDCLPYAAYINHSTIQQSDKQHDTKEKKTFIW